MSFIFLLLLFAIVFIIILIPTFLFSVIRTILSMLGFLFTGKRRRPSYREGSGSFYEHSSNDSQRREHSSASRKKVFEKDEGEYVDFEEIKEDK